MALSEAEELELLQLQKSKAMATQPSAENSNQSINMPVAKFAAKQALNLLPQAHPIENLPTIGGDWLSVGRSRRNGCRHGSRKNRPKHDWNCSRRPQCSDNSDGRGIASDGAGCPGRYCPGTKSSK